MKVALAVVALAFFAGSVFATPSTTYWTTCAMDIQPYKILHFGIDNYFTVNKKSSSGQQGAFPSDVQLTLGVLPYEKIQMEIGIDAFYPSDNPFYFHAKIGTPENALFDGSPGINAGIFNVGTKKGATDFNIADFIMGKTLPMILGRLHLGYYVGNSATLVSGTGAKENSGFMIAYDRGFFPTKDFDGSEYNKIVVAADYASGKNLIGGGGGVGLYYFFNRNVSMLVGPVWFNDQIINGATKWTTQLDINF